MAATIRTTAAAVMTGPAVHAAVLERGDVLAVEVAPNGRRMIEHVIGRELTALGCDAFPRATGDVLTFYPGPGCAD